MARYLTILFFLVASTSPWALSITEIQRGDMLIVTDDYEEHQARVLAVVPEKGELTVVHNPSRSNAQPETLAFENDKYWRIIGALTLNVPTTLELLSGELVEGTVTGLDVETWQPGLSSVIVFVETEKGTLTLRSTEIFWK